eukprot:1151808-Pelagomonas_calceolata.AAC.6
MSREHSFSAPLAQVRSKTFPPTGPTIIFMSGLPVLVPGYEIVTNYSRKGGGRAVLRTHLANWSCTCMQYSIVHIQKQHAEDSKNA